MPKKKESVEATVRSIRRVTRKKYSAEEKVRIVLEGLRGEASIAALCRREGIPSNLYYRWSKAFLEAGKQRLVGDTERQADTRQVTEMRAELNQLKQLVAELALKNRVLTPALAGGARETENRSLLLDVQSLTELRQLVGVRMLYYNNVRRYSSIGYRAPSQFIETLQPWL